MSTDNFIMCAVITAATIKTEKLPGIIEQINDSNTFTIGLSRISKYPNCEFTQLNTNIIPINLAMIKNHFSYSLTKRLILSRITKSSVISYPPVSGHSSLRTDQYDAVYGNTSSPACGLTDTATNNKQYQFPYR